MFSQAHIRKQKLSEEQNSGKPRSGTSASAKDDNNDDDHGVNKPPVPQQTVNVLYHIDDLNLLKVLGEGGFGKVKILISFGSEFVKCMRLFSLALGWILKRSSTYPGMFYDGRMKH